MRNLVYSLAAMAVLVMLSGSFAYWYTHRHPIFVDSLRVIQEDRKARQLLGEPISASPIVWMKVSERRATGAAEYSVRGSRGEAEAIVSAAMEGPDEWRLRYIWLKRPGGRIVVVRQAEKD